MRAFIDAQDVVTRSELQRATHCLRKTTINIQQRKGLFNGNS
jgi:hypothetical protein